MRFEVNDKLAKKPSAANPIPNWKELVAATLAWFQQNKEDMTKPRLVVDFAAKGWHVLFTPPYCPDLQPIELFWAAGKNYARSMHPGHTRDLEAVASDLRIGWYGDGKPGGKAAVNCAGLVRTSIKKANERVATDEFLSGTIDGGLEASDECELEVGVDEIGRATRTMSRRAAQGGKDDPAVNGTGARGDDSDDEDDDDDDDDDSDEEE